MAHNHVKGDGSWWEHDARGFELCRVCHGCRAEKLAQYRPEVLTDVQYDASDLGDDEDYIGDDYTNHFSVEY